MWLELKDLVDLRTCTFVDFGCGCGFALLTAMKLPLKAIVGVDMHQRSTELARAHTDRCMSATQTKCRNVDIVCADMLDYTFEPSERIILFMYEPLWTLPRERAHATYKSVLEHARRSVSKELLVAYFYAGRYCGDALPALAEMKAEKCHQSKYFSLFFGSHEDFYIFRLPALGTHECRLEEPIMDSS